MKHAYLYRLLAIALMTYLTGSFSVTAGAESTSSARFINMETPFRCSVQKIGDLDVVTTLVLRPEDFKLTFFDKMDTLPRYEVNGMSFKKLPIDEALQQLVDEADITVYTEDGFYPTMDADGVYGELTDVVDELTASGGVFYRYDAYKKEMYLSRRGRFELQLPDNRMVMLAVLDALRGAGIDTVQPDWKNGTVLMSLTTEEKETVEDLVKFIEQDHYLLLADMQLFTVQPRISGANWQKVIRRFGASRIYAANNGLTGKILSIGNQIPYQQFLATVGNEFLLTPVTQGISIVPNNWKMRFNVGQCAIRKDIGSLSVLLNTNIRSPEKVETNITLDSAVGEITSFNAVSAIDNELVIVGIPTPTETQDELLVTIKLRLIRLIRE